MTVHIRSERVADYHRIAEINALAFYQYMEQPLTSTYLPEFALVDALRHSANYDPELALVAVVDGDVVGHALFYPLRVLIGGEEVKAVSMGPIAVDPPFQKRGIGAQLMDEGHRRASDRGYAFSFLLGHESYYPRFGYLTNMFGECRLEVGRENIPKVEAGLEERLVLPEDIELLVAMWRYWFEDVDLAVFPGISVLDWITHVEEIMSAIVTRGEEVIGYVRYAKSDPVNVKLFLAKDTLSTLLLLQHLDGKIGEADVAAVRLPLHPESRAVRECIGLPYEVKLATWGAAMIKVLDADNRAIGAYCDEVGRGSRKPGLLIYPPCVEFA